MAVAKGEAKWCRLLTPSVETDDYPPKYSVDLFVDDETKARLEGEGLKAKPEKDGDKNPTGREFFRFWTHGKNKKTGAVNPPVRIVDKFKKPVSEEPGNGSLVRVKYDTY